MAFSTNCTSKGCYKMQEPYLDINTNIVYCSLCDNEIQNISSFTKASMKRMKQFRQKQKVSFSFKCTSCDKEDRPENVKGEIVCRHCKNPMSNISAAFKRMLKEQLKELDIDKDVP